MSAPDVLFVSYADTLPAEHRDAMRLCEEVYRMQALGSEVCRCLEVCGSTSGTRFTITGRLRACC